MAAATPTPATAPTTRASSTGQVQRSRRRPWGAVREEREGRVGSGSYSMSLIIGGIGGSGLSAPSGGDTKAPSRLPAFPEDRMEPQSPPPPASPFNPAPRPAAPQRAGGCSKPLIVGCVVVFLVGAIALLGGLWYVSTHAAALLQWSFQQTETSVLAQLPKDVTPEERANLQQAFADVRQALRDGK